MKNECEDPEFGAFWTLNPLAQFPKSLPLDETIRPPMPVLRQREPAKEPHAPVEESDPVGIAVTSEHPAESEHQGAARLFARGAPEAHQPTSERDHQHDTTRARDDVNPSQDGAPPGVQDTTAGPPALWKPSLSHDGEHELPLISIQDLSGYVSLDGKGDQRATAEPEVEKPPEECPDLQAIGVLGEGGSGRVLLAHQHSLDRKVAIKSLNLEGGRSPIAGWLRHEGRIMGSLAHPNIPPLHALGRDVRNLPVLVMRHIDGVSWRTLIRSPHDSRWAHLTGAEPLIRHIEILMSVCQGVAFAHSQHVIHRDLKPANVMIGDFGEVYVVDWGLAERLTGDHVAQPFGLRKSTLNRPVGTPVYMAPEMLAGDLAYVDERTDVYLLGAMLHEVLTGQARHQRDTLVQVILSVSRSLPYKYPETSPRELAEICNRAMHVDIDQRFASVNELHAALAEYLHHRSSLELTSAAGAQLEELASLLDANHGRSQHGDATDGAGSMGIRETYASSEFTYLQALREWPDNPQALMGLQRCITLMCHYELDIRQLNSAEDLLGRLESPPGDLVGRLRAVREEFEHERREREELSQLRVHMDFDSAARPRFKVFVGLGAFFIVVILVNVMVVGFDSDNYGYRESIVSDLLGLLVYGAVVFWKRRVIMNTRINRHFFWLVGFTFLATFSVRLLTWSMGLELRESFTLEMLCFVWLFLAGGLMLKPWLFLCAVISAVGCLGIWLFPGIYLDLYILAVLAVWGTIILMIRRIRVRVEQVASEDPV